MKEFLTTLMLTIKKLLQHKDGKLVKMSKIEIEELTEDDLSNIIIVTQSNRFFKLKELKKNNEN